MMIGELITVKHPACKCSHILQTGALMTRKKGGGFGTHFKNEPDTHRVARECDFGVQSTLYILVMRDGFRRKSGTNFDLHPRNGSGRSHSVSSIQTTCWCSGCHVHHHEHSMRAVGDHVLHCNQPVCTVGDRVLSAGPHDT